MAHRGQIASKWDGALTKQLLVTSPKSRKVVNTMRAGALGRMQELGLVRSEQDGRRVSYHLRGGGSDSRRETNI